MCHITYNFRICVLTSFYSTRKFCYICWKLYTWRDVLKLLGLTNSIWQVSVLVESTEGITGLYLRITTCIPCYIPPMD